MWYVAETGSTNADLLARPESSDRTVLVAGHQTAGRGRLDRTWEAPPGANLLASILFRDVPDEPGDLTHAVGIAAVDAVLAVAGAEARLKWPNDVLLDKRKVAGLLLETVGPETVAIGIGINLADHPEGTETPAISVNSATGRAIDPDDALCNLAARFAAWYGTWRSQGFAGLKPHWLKRASGLGGPIRARLVDREIKGVFEDLDHDGALLLRSDAGLTRITAAEVFLEGLR